jgi:hypothetical protein
MLKDIKSYVGFDILEYLRQTEAIIPRTTSFTFQQSLDYIFPSVFLKMTGSLEHKLDMITMQLASDDDRVRQGLMRHPSGLPSGSADVYKTYRTTAIVIKTNYKNDFTCPPEKDDGTIWNNRDVLTGVVKNLVDFLGNSGLSEYFRSEYNILSASPNVLPKKLKFFNSEKDKEQEMPFSKVIFNQAMRFRNIYAHNEDSVYTDFKNPNQLNNETAIYDNWCFRFVAVLYVDSIVRDVFGQYIRLSEKYYLK